MSRIWAKGCVLMIVCVCYLTCHDYPTLEEGESHDILFVLLQQTCQLLIGINYYLLLLKEVGRARLRKSDVHTISQKTPAPQHQPIDRKKRKGNIVEEYSRDRAA